MPTPQKHLIIGSTAAHSGKSTLSIALGQRLKDLGFQVGWGKPLASVDSFGYGVGSEDDDLRFVPLTLSLTPQQQRPNLLSLDSHTLAESLGQANPEDLKTALETYWRDAVGDVFLLEGPSNLDEGAFFNLSLPEMAIALNASVVLIIRFNARHMVDQVISAQKRLGAALLGIVINEVEEEDFPLVAETVVPYLENLGVPVLATLPQVPFLRGIRVSELVQYLDAEVLCCEDHLDLMVESLKIGAMNVNAALRFFGQGVHQAVVTGGDRRDLQIAALETSTHCLILTGQLAPAKDVIALAKDKEVPVLTVVTDTLSTVERIDTLFGRIPLNNPEKLPLIREELAQRIDLDRLLSLLALERPAIMPHG